MNDFGFTEADLQANREGRMTEGQIEMLKQKSQQQILLGVAGAVIGIVLLAFISRPPDNFLLKALALFLWVWAMCAAYAGYRWLQTDIESGIADSISGQAALRVSRSGRNSRSYHLAVSGKAFHINRAKYQVLDRYLHANTSRDFTIYFTPTANVLLSIEE